MAGSDFPQAAQRVERMIELVGAVRALLAGETLTTSGTHIRLQEAVLSEPRPVQGSIPLMVGGNGRRVLAFAAESAEIAGVTGLAKTLPDGHSHNAEWSSAALDATFRVIDSAAKRFGRRPDIEALVQHVEITDEPRRVAEGIAGRIPGVSADDLLGAPFMWIGTPDLIAKQIHESEQRWGVNRYVIRDTAIDAVSNVLPLLRAVN